MKRLLRISLIPHGSSLRKGSEQLLSRAGALVALTFMPLLILQGLQRRYHMLAGPRVKRSRRTIAEIIANRIVIVRKLNLHLIYRAPLHFCHIDIFFKFLLVKLSHRTILIIPAAACIRCVISQ